MFKIPLHFYGEIFYFNILISEISGFYTIVHLRIARIVYVHAQSDPELDHTIK
jgi:hypothetical protein